MAETMKAQMFHEPKKMEYGDFPVPEISDDQLLVRVKACGICGSDVAYYWGLSPLETEDGKGPLILGHEFTGEIVAVGSVPAGLDLFQEGDRVVINPVQHCNACEICAKGQVNLCENKDVLGVSVDGGFAEYTKSKYTHAVKLPDNVSFEQGALTEPLACATYGIKNLQVELGAFCVVIGPGAIGLMMVQLAKSSGAGTVVLVGTRDYRLEAGKQLGADLVINTADEKSKWYCKDLKGRIADLTGGRMADRVITSTGSVQATEQALDISGRRSVVVFFGLPGAEDKIAVPALESIFWDKTIRFSWLAPFTWPTALQAISTGLVNVDPLITHTFQLANLIEGLTKVKERQDQVVKAVVVPPS